MFAKVAARRVPEAFSKVRTLEGSDGSLPCMGPWPGGEALWQKMYLGHSNGLT